MLSEEQHRVLLSLQVYTINFSLNLQTDLQKL